MQTNLDEPLEFLDIVASKGFWNDNTVQARRTACKKFFDILDEDQKNVEYVRDNLDVIKGRYMNLNKDAAGATVDEYGRRVKLVLDEFVEWKADRSGWEKKNAAKQTARPPEGQKKSRAEKPSAQASTGTNGAGHDDTKPPSRTVTFPLRPDFDLTITLPRDGITVEELKRLPYFLLPYARDWEPSQSQRGVFNMLES
ncbi:MAG TPA: hypothetical protein VFX20_06570 [Steroidobacteraceae bacterium]|nr:hypothetical protein [Steroidobacteraceae bacterium]